MVLESLIKAKNAEKHPSYLFVLGIIYGTVGILFELWLFHGKIPNLFIFITVFASIPLIHKIITLEEKKDRSIAKESNLLKEHKKALISFITLFLGILVAYTFWYTVLPQEETNVIFAQQMTEIPALRQSVATGHAIAPTTFSAVFANNLKVLILSVVFSFFFGAGALFILAWNAALIAVALGSFIHDALATTPNAGLWYILGTVSYAFFGYMAHSIFEISAYFIAALAGGIISVAVIKHDLFHKNFQRIVQDALWLVALSLILLAVGAWVETGMSPIIFQ